jgi:hypothetical protein
MPSPDELDTLIQNGFAGYPTPGAGPAPQPSPPAHRVLWFAVGMVLWQANGILLYLFLWLLLHG